MATRTRRVTREKQKVKAKAKAKAKPKAKVKKQPVHMGKAILRPGTMTDKIREDMLKLDKARAKKYGVTLEEFRRAMGRGETTKDK